MWGRCRSSRPFAQKARTRTKGTARTARTIKTRIAVSYCPCSPCSPFGPCPWISAALLRSPPPQQVVHRDLPRPLPDQPEEHHQEGDLRQVGQAAEGVDVAQPGGQDGHH